VDMVEAAEKEIKKERDEAGEGNTHLIGVVASQLVQILFAARASSLGAISNVYGEDPSERHLRFNQGGGLEMVFLHVKGWKNGKQKTTGRKLPVWRMQRDAIPPGRTKGHFRNRCFEVIREAMQARTFIRWSGPEEAHSEISKDLEEHGLRDAVPGRIISSHSGRKTCVSAGMEMGCEKGVMQEWMLTATDQTDTYRERHYALNKQVRDLLDFLLQRTP
jgi:hypothetical protein